MSRLTLIALMSLLAANVQAQSIDFDLPFQPVDDLTISGVTFDFKIGGVDSGDAFVGSFGPGTLSTVSDPSLTGNSTGILTLTFDFPTPTLEFGAALSTADSLSPGFTVELFDAADQSFATTAVDTTEVGGAIAFSEAMFSHTGTPVSKAVIDFADAPGNFAFDNLTYQVPEPSSVLLLITAVASISLLGRRHRRL